MTQTQFVLADGGHARWVVRAGGEGDNYVTTTEQTASFRAAEDASFAGGAARRGEEDFAKALADEINARATPAGFERLVLVAPAHFLSDVRERLSTTATAKLARTLAKDLTNTPDHELATWLASLERDLDLS